jgi:hypothetical protein
MNAPQPHVPKKYFVITDSRESGPFSPAILNRMFSKGEIQGALMCRREDASEVCRLDEVFRHMGPSKAIAITARTQAAEYSVKTGKGSLGLGLIFLGINVVTLLTIQRIFPWLIIAGVILIPTGYRQLRRGQAELDLMRKRATQAQGEPGSETIAPETLPKASKHDY